MNRKPLAQFDPQIARSIADEIHREEFGLELIASENYVSRAVLEALGSVMTNKYAEGYPAKRYYGGCEFVDVAEELAIERVKKLFGAEHANVQPHSGAQANMAVYLATLKPGDTMMGMSLSHGGHLTHGSPANFTGKTYNVVPYGLNPDTERIDFNIVRELAKQHKPKLIVCGASAYSRDIDFKSFREIADEVGALLMADIAHPAGLIASGLHSNPIPYCHFVTSTTHKTLRGPRGGLVMCKAEFAKAINSAVFPGLQGGPLMHVIAAKAVAFLEDLQPDYKEYCGQIIKNAKALSGELAKNGFRIVSGGTDNHLFNVDLTEKGYSGKDAEETLGKAGITVNKNTIPRETRSPFITSGMRIGTAAVTTRGMKETEMQKIAGFITSALSDMANTARLEEIKRDVEALCKKFPVYA